MLFISVWILVGTNFSGLFVITSEKEVIVQAVTLIVDDDPSDYSLIQSAIDAANPGDTIYVKNGTYYENVVINKSISIIGEKKDSTFINGSGINDVIYIGTNWVNITGFTITNSGSNISDAGIELNNAQNCKIFNNNIFYNNNNGIFVNNSFENNITGNNISFNRHYNINLYHSNNNSIIGNIASGGYPEWANFTVERNITITPNNDNYSMDYYIDIPTPKDIPDSIDPNIQEVIGVVTIPNPNATEIKYPDYTWMVWEDDHVTTSRTITIRYSLYTRSYISSFNPNDSGTVDDIPTWLKDKYGNKTTQEYKIVPTHPQIQNLSNGLTDGKNSVYDKLYAIYEYINSNIIITALRSGEPKYCYDTLNDRFGDSDDISILFVSLARAAEIPAWLEFGPIYNQQENSWGGHVWVKVYIPDIFGSGNVSYIDMFSHDFLFRDPYRFTEWESDGIGTHMEDYYYFLGTNFRILENYITISFESSFSTQSGIYLDNSNNNTILNNTIYSNNKRGIHLSNSCENNLNFNNISHNDYGVYLDSSSYNMIYHNNFINNEIQAFDDGTENYWNSSYPTGGNYWSDYNGSDLYTGPNQDILGNDGLGDTNYTIFGWLNADYYPLMEPVNISEWIQPHLTIPFSPQNIQVTSGNGYVSLAWDEPSADGGSPIIRYIIYRSETQGKVTYLTEIEDVLNYNDTDVTNNVTYFYRISAKNVIGEGPLSDDFNATPSIPAVLDSDQDSLPDNWEQSYFGNLNQGPDDDYDGDGYSNIEEFNANTDPTNKNDPSGIDGTGRQENSFLSQYWWIFIVVIGIIAVLIIFLFRKRTPQISEEIYDDTRTTKESDEP